jgi:hypothetical protein
MPKLKRQSETTNESSRRTNKGWAAFIEAPIETMSAHLCYSLEPSLSEIIQRYTSLSLKQVFDLFVQTYRSHPFLDVYARYCNKGMAFDLVTHKILNINTAGEGGKGKGILYLGDSENDNPAFRKASVSIGVISDKRLAPKLDCQYLIEFKNLYSFPKNLVRSKFVFLEDLLKHIK